jgi:hypothetical protein
MTQPQRGVRLCIPWQERREEASPRSSNAHHLLSVWTIMPPPYAEDMRSSISRIPPRRRDEYQTA